MSWGKVDADVTQFGGAWTIADATGGGQIGLRHRCVERHHLLHAAQLPDHGQRQGLRQQRLPNDDVDLQGQPGLGLQPGDEQHPDAWIADGVIGGTTYTIGWLDGDKSFDVVSAACTQTSATPSAPVIFQPDGVYPRRGHQSRRQSCGSLPSRCGTSVAGRMFVQPDGATQDNAAVARPLNLGNHAESKACFPA